MFQAHWRFLSLLFRKVLRQSNCILFELIAGWRACMRAYVRPKIALEHEHVVHIIQGADDAEPPGTSVHLWHLNVHAR